MKKNWAYVAIWLVGAIPAIFFGYWVHKYGVAVPKSDDWSVAMPIAKAHAGGFAFSELFVQQQEGRAILPKLAFIATTWRGYWDVRDLMWTSVGICAVTAAGVFWLLRMSDLSTRATAICFWIASALIFTPAQSEVITFAFGFPSFLPALFILASLLILRTSASIRLQLVLCALLATASSFTLPHGLLAWALTFPLLAVSGHVQLRSRWTLIWSLACISCALVYFWGYSKPNDQPEFAPSVSLLNYAIFVFGFLGGAFQSASTAPLLTAATLGAILLTAYVAAGVIIYRRRGDDRLLCKSLPWFALGAYSIGSALLASFGRIGYGVLYCLSPRYVTFSIWLFIADAVLIALLLPKRAGSPPWMRVTVVPICSIALLLGLTGHLVAAPASIDALRLTAARDRLGRAAVQMSGMLDTRSIVQDTVSLARVSQAETLRLLDSLALLRPRLLKTANLAAFEHQAVDGKTAAGYVEISAGCNGVDCEFGGWAALPQKSRPADAVVLAYATPSGEWIAFAMSDMHLPRPDVAEQYGDRKASKDLLWSGWRVKFSRASVPTGATISAWAFDSDEVKFYRLIDAIPGSL